MTIRLPQGNLDFQALDSDELSGVHPLLRNRASCGSFSADGLAWSQIIQLLQAARCAPSSWNSQPWHFVVLPDGPQRREINDDLVAWGAPWAAKAPVLIAVVADLAESTIHAGVNYAFFDCGLAVQNILLQAESMGLAAHPVGFCARETCSRALGLQPHHVLVLFVAVGHLGADPTATQSSRLRKPLNAIASLGQIHSALATDMG